MAVCSTPGGTLLWGFNIYRYGKKNLCGVAKRSQMAEEEVGNNAEG